MMKERSRGYKLIPVGAYTADTVVNVKIINNDNDISYVNVC